MSESYIIEYCKQSEGKGSQHIQGLQQGRYSLLAQPRLQMPLFKVNMECILLGRVLAEELLVYQNWRKCNVDGSLFQFTLFFNLFKNPQKIFTGNFL